jgi:hypothetical protein
MQNMALPADLDAHKSGSFKIGGEIEIHRLGKKMSPPSKSDYRNEEFATLRFRRGVMSAVGSKADISDPRCSASFWSWVVCARNAPRHPHAFWRSIGAEVSLPATPDSTNRCRVALATFTRHLCLGERIAICGVRCC